MVSTRQYRRQTSLTTSNQLQQLQSVASERITVLESWTMLELATFWGGDISSVKRWLREAIQDFVVNSPPRIGTYMGLAPNNILRKWAEIHKAKWEARHAMATTYARTHFPDRYDEMVLSALPALIHWEYKRDACQEEYEGSLKELEVAQTQREDELNPFETRASKRPKISPTQPKDAMSRSSESMKAQRPAVRPTQPERVNEPSSENLELRKGTRHSIPDGPFAIPACPEALPKVHKDSQLSRDKILLFWDAKKMEHLRAIVLAKLAPNLSSTASVIDVTTLDIQFLQREVHSLQVAHDAEEKVIKGGIVWLWKDRTGAFGWFPIYNSMQFQQALICERNKGEIKLGIKLRDSDRFPWEIGSASAS